MKAAGIIVEFNPLHNGHIEHLRETVRLTAREHIVGVMSGNFVQRGEPAIIDKWRRTKMALLAGVDIVIELPVAYVVSGADYFARGAVELLATTRIVDKLCFGSECGDIEKIKEAGRVLAEEPDKYKKALGLGLDRGLSFAAARGAALGEVLGDVPDGLLTKPNNSLGMEYCKALWQLNWPMEVCTSYRGAGGPSATAIRKAVWSGEKAEMMPPYAFKILKDAIQLGEIHHLNDYSQILRYMLFTTHPDMGEGLENRFRHFAREHSRLTDILDAVKTKRYTYTRLQRAALCVILGIDKALMNINYIRVLGFRREKANLLGEMTRHASLPVLTTGKDMDQLEGPAANMLGKDLEVGDIYQMANSSDIRYPHERGMPLVIV